MTPEYGFTSPAIVRASVVFPEPLSPTRATSSSDRRLRSTPLTTSIRRLPNQPALTVKRHEMLSVWITGLVTVAMVDQLLRGHPPRSPRGGRGRRHRVAPHGR